MTPQILLYNITNEEQKKKIKALVLRLKIRARIVEKNRYGEPIGRLAGMDIAPMDVHLNEGSGEMEKSLDRSSDALPEADMADFSDEMLIFCFLPDGLLNQMLQGLRKAGVFIPLKAVLTPSNCMWDSYTIHQEITAEHEMMHRTQE